MAPSFTLGAGVLQAAVTALSNADAELATVIAGVAGPTTTVVAPGADTVSIPQAAAVTAWGATIQTALANGQSYATQFLANLSNASDTYSFAEAANAASATASAAASPAATAGDGGILTTIAQLLGGPSGSLNGQPFSLSSNAANYMNIGGGNWASAASDLLGMAGGGLLPAGSDTIGDAGVAAALASETTPVGAGMGGGFGAMPMGAMGGGTLVGNLSAPPSWGGTVTPVAGTATSPLRTVGWTGAAPEAASGSFIPGMPGMVTGGAGRSAAGFGAPRYGVKPIVMPKLASV